MNSSSADQNSNMNSNVNSTANEFSFCGNCGTKLDKNTKFCPNCGKQNI